jgi:hypothetical protein
MPPKKRDDIKAALLSKGFVHEGGDHDFYVFKHAGMVGAVFTQISRGSGYREYGDPLLHDMSRQLKLTRKQLNELIDCSLDQRGYEAALRARGALKDLPKRPE